MLQTDTRIPDVRKIAVLRANGLGDLMFVLPALEALRAAYPQAEITLLSKAWPAPFLDGRPGPVQRVIPVPTSRGVNGGAETPDDPAELERFFAAMREERFDLALQLHGGGRFSNPFLSRLGARVTAGLKTPDAAPLDRWLPYIYFQNEVARFLEVVALIGAAPVALEPRLSVTARDRAESRAVIPEGQRPLVALHPGATDPERRWPPERFAAVGDALAREGAQIVVTGTGDEREVVAAVVEAMRAEATPLCDRLSLGGLAGLLARCAVVISNDSGPLHLAAAVGARTVGIYWCFNFVNAGPFTRMRQRPVISWRATCPVCGIDRAHERCDHHPSFVADVSVDETLAAARDLLAMADD